MGWPTDSAGRDRPDRRGERRFTLRLSATAIQDGYEVRGRIRNISGGGALLELDPIAASSLFFDRPLELAVADFGRYPARVAWKSATLFGLSFRVSESMANHIRNRVQQVLARPLADLDAPASDPHGRDGD